MIIPEDTHDTVYCKICGKGMKTLGPHFKSHQITADDYKKMFPEALTQSEEERLKACERAIKSNAKHKGKKRDPSIGAKVSATKKANPTPSVWLGRKHSEETKQKLSQKRKQQYASGEITHWNTGNITSEETKQKIREATKGSKLTEEQYKRWEEAMIELRSSPDYVAPMTGKKHPPEARAKLSISAKRNAEKQKQEARDLVIKQIENSNAEYISDEDYVYFIKCKKCQMEFKKRHELLVVYRRTDKENKICPKCYPSKGGLNWSYSIFENKPELKELNGELYIVRMYNQYEDFIKIGITSGTAHQRWQNFKNYQVEILHTISTTIYEAFVLEQILLIEFSHKQYIPNFKFGGKSECLNNDCLLEVLEFIRNYQQKEETISAFC